MEANQNEIVKADIPAEKEIQALSEMLVEKGCLSTRFIVDILEAVRVIQKSAFDRGGLQSQSRDKILASVETTASYKNPGEERIKSQMTHGNIIVACGQERIAQMMESCISGRKDPLIVETSSGKPVQIIKCGSQEQPVDLQKYGEAPSKRDSDVHIGKDNYSGGYALEQSTAAGEHPCYYGSSLSAEDIEKTFEAAELKTGSPTPLLDLVEKLLPKEQPIKVMTVDPMPDHLSDVFQEDNGRPKKKGKKK